MVFVYSHEASGQFQSVKQKRQKKKDMLYFFLLTQLKRKKTLRWIVTVFIELQINNSMSWTERILLSVNTSQKQF